MQLFNDILPLQDKWDIIIITDSGLFLGNNSLFQWRTEVDRECECEREKESKSKSESERESKKARERGSIDPPGYQFSLYFCVVEPGMWL